MCRKHERYSHRSPTGGKTMNPYEYGDPYEYEPETEQEYNELMKRNAEAQEWFNRMYPQEG